MTRTVRRRFVVASIACLLAVSTLAGAVGAGSLDAAPPRPVAPPGSLAAFAERAGATADHGPARATAFRDTIELIILVTMCAIVVAFYSASSGGQGRKRVPTRIRRR
jgi:hypothetical protein